MSECFCVHIFIHKYLHKEAVDDKVILDLQYEARDVEQAISSKDKLDKKKDDITKGLTQERKEKIEDRWATLEKVYSSKERIERIGYSIINDVESGMLKYDWCNAIFDRCRCQKTRNTQSTAQQLFGSKRRMGIARTLG